MAHPAFDTLKFAKELEASGLPAAQAEAIVKAQNNAFEEVFNTNVATKTDINEVKLNAVSMHGELKQDIHSVYTELKQDINDLRIEVKEDINNLRIEVKEDINNLRTEVKKDVNNLRIEFKKEFYTLKSDYKVLKWMISFMSAGILSLIIKSFF